MAGPARLVIEVVGNASAAVSDLDRTGSAAIGAAGDVDKLGASFDDAVRKSRDMSQVADNVDEVGSASGRSATGLNDLAGVFELVGQSDIAERMGVVSTVMDAAAGAADLYMVATQLLTVENIKNVASTVARTASVVASTVAMTAVTIATGLWTAAQWLLNIALNANPIGLIVLAIAALIAIIILVVKNWDTLRDAAVGAWQTIWNAIRTAWNWLEANVFNRVVEVVQANIAVYQALWQAVKDVWEKIVNAVSDNVLTRAIQKVIDTIKDLIDWFGRLKFPEMPSWVTSLLGKINPFTVTEGTRVFRLATATARSPGAPSTLATETTALVTRAANVGIHVDVFLDGTKVKGIVQRVVDRAMRDDGARFLAGAWAP